MMTSVAIVIHVTYLIKVETIGKKKKTSHTKSSSMSHI